MNGGIIALSLLAVIATFGQTSGLLTPSTLEEYKPKILGSLEWVKTLLKEAERKTVRSWTIRHFTDPKNRWTADLTGVTVSGASNIEIKSVVTVPKTLTINIVATLPKITIEGQYIANGLLDGNAVSGNGNVAVDITKTNVVASVKLGAIWNKVKVDNVNLSYNIGDISVSAKNLKIKGTWFFLVNSKVAKHLLANARLDTPRLSKVFGEALSIVSNAFISGTRLADTKAWVTSFVANRIPLP